jgi:hypothetical protein
MFTHFKVNIFIETILKDLKIWKLANIVEKYVKINMV